MIVTSEPKNLLSPPYHLLYNDYNDVIGGLREKFFAEMLAGASIECHYLKSTRGSKTPDFLVRDKLTMLLYYAKIRYL